MMICHPPDYKEVHTIQLVVEARRTEMVYQIWEEGETFMGILVILIVMKPRTSDDESYTP